VTNTLAYFGQNGSGEEKGLIKFVELFEDDE
jgi:hypothetical protein